MWRLLAFNLGHGLPTGRIAIRSIVNVMVTVATIVYVLTIRNLVGGRQHVINFRIIIAIIPINTMGMTYSSAMYGMSIS